MSDLNSSFHLLGYYWCSLVLLHTLNILSYGRPLDLVPAAFLFYTGNGLVLSFNNITYHCYADVTQPNLSFPSGNTQSGAFICGCLPATSGSALTRVNLFPGCFCFLQDLSFITNNTIVTPGACQQFHCNCWQLAVIHQTFTTTTYLYAFFLHFSKRWLFGIHMSFFV